MQIILFSYRKKDNKRTSRNWFGCLATLILLAISPVSGAGQSNWDSPLYKCWEVETESPVAGQIASDNDSIFFSTSNGTITSIHNQNGSVRWRADLGGNLDTEIIGKNDTIYSFSLFGDNRNIVSRAIFRELNPSSGMPVWNFDYKIVKMFKFAPISIGGLLYSETAIVLVDLNGKVVWRREYSGTISSIPFESNDAIVFGTGNRSIIAVSKTDGSILFQLNSKEVPNVLVAGSTGFLYSGDSRGNIYAFSKVQTEPIWTAKTGGGISHLEFYENDLIALSKDNFVYRISGDGGNKIWKRKLAGRILGMSKIDDTHAVFTTSGGSTAIVLDLEDGRLANKYEVSGDFVGAPVKTKNGFAVATRNTVTAITNTACKN